jgi:outer membrane protein OmpA-like peptidoglycan-associated protein
MMLAGGLLAEAGTARAQDALLPGAIPDYVGLLGTYVDPTHRRHAEYEFGGGSFLAGYRLSQQITAEVQAYGAGLSRDGRGRPYIAGVGGDLRANERHGLFISAGAGVEYGSIDDSHRANPYLEASAGIQHRLFGSTALRLQASYRELAGLGGDNGHYDSFGGELWASAGLVFGLHKYHEDAPPAMAPAPAVELVPVHCPPAPQGLAVDAEGVLVPQDARVVPVGFDTNSASLDTAALDLLAQLAAALRCDSAQQLAVQVVGHADERGGEIYNVQLSLRRAAAVREALIADGLSAERIGIDGVGNYEPLDKASKPADNPVNRRIQIKLYPGVAPE